MEWILIDLTAYLSTAIHAVLTFVMWLAVVVGTAFVLVYNRVSEGMHHVMVRDDDKKDDA